jgi:DNA-directed RNA polymerase subunit RPC12/RpoP
MPQCGSCGHHLTRIHRTALEKLVYADAFRCPTCGTRQKRPHQALDPHRSFVLSLSTRCIRCGSPRIERLKSRDYIDRVSRHPLSLLLAVTGAPLNRCPSCRLQYHDWRPTNGKS